MVCTFCLVCKLAVAPIVDRDDRYDRLKFLQATPPLLPKCYVDPQIEEKLCEAPRLA